MDSDQRDDQQDPVLDGGETLRSEYAITRAWKEPGPQRRPERADARTLEQSPLSEAKPEYRISKQSHHQQSNLHDRGSIPMPTGLEPTLGGQRGSFVWGPTEGAGVDV